VTAPQDRTHLGSVVISQIEDGNFTDRSSTFRWSLCLEVGGKILFSVNVYKSDSYPSNMLTITFATRTDSTLDPLTDCALALATEFMDLTGDYYSDFIRQLRLS